MSWNEIFQIISGVIISVGGAGAIIWKLSSYLGKIWAEKHLESIKKEYQKEIESYKTQLDMLKETTLRYSGQQFELYTKLVGIVLIFIKLLLKNTRKMVKKKNLRM